MSVKELEKYCKKYPYYIMSTARVLLRGEYMTWALFFLYSCFLFNWQMLAATVPILIAAIVVAYLRAKIWKKFGYSFKVAFLKNLIAYALCWALSVPARLAFTAIIDSVRYTR